MIPLDPLWRWLRFGGLPPNEFRRRTTAVEMGLYMSGSGIVYALVYVALGYGNVPAVGLIYVASFGLNLVLLRLTGRFNLYEQIQLLSAVLFPLVAHIQIGGFQNSSMVVLAVFLAPAAALLFSTTAQARRYFYAVALTLIVAGIWDYFYAPRQPQLPRLVLGVFIVFIPLSIFTILYFLMEGFRRKQEELRAELQQSLDHLRATQAQLIQSEKMASLGELTAGIAHEIQNPLNFVNNFAEVSVELLDELRQEQQKPNEARDLGLENELLTDLVQNLEKISLHGRRADGIVKGMLQHSRSSSGQRESTDLNALSDEYLRLAYHGLRAKDKSFNAQFSAMLDPALGLVSVLAQDMGRVLLNLFTNAFYAVRERQRDQPAAYQPTVTVATRRLPQHVEIRVRDNGTGIPAALRAKIFQPFFTTKPTGEGTGLGLSLAYDIITKGHGGALTVDSQEGAFTEFIITLPTDQS